MVPSGSSDFKVVTPVIASRGSRVWLRSMARGSGVPAAMGTARRVESKVENNMVVRVWGEDAFRNPVNQEILDWNVARR